MSTVDIDDGAYAKLQLLARAWDCDVSAVVERLLGSFLEAPHKGERVENNEKPELVPIHLTYEGTRVDALFDPTSTAVTVLSGALGGNRFKSPSGAAGSVIHSLKPQIKPNRNGWSTWIVSATGHLLQTLRHRRPAGSDG
ncbi:MAG TPA: hypothetical protein VHB02_19300 [Acidimicrobiales bacterium]|nr:hypothetical protein [Acidimicrobiales bacterium]